MKYNDLIPELMVSDIESGLPPIFVPTCELVKTVRWHPHSFLGLATW